MTKRELSRASPSSTGNEDRQIALQAQQLELLSKEVQALKARQAKAAHRSRGRAR